jgi:hypothetical protein
MYYVHAYKKNHPSRQLATTSHEEAAQFISKAQSDGLGVFAAWKRGCKPLSLSK